MHVFCRDQLYSDQLLIFEQFIAKLIYNHDESLTQIFEFSTK